MKAPYIASVRKYHPQGYPKPYWSAVVARQGAKRATDICIHSHSTPEAAAGCAATLLALRQTRSK